MAEKFSPEQMLRYTLVIERPFSSECDDDGVPWAEANGTTPEYEILKELSLDFVNDDVEGEGVWAGAKVSLEREVVKPDADEVHNALITDIVALGGDEANEVDFNGLMRNIALAREYSEDETVDAELRDDLRTAVKKAREAIDL